MSTKNISSLVVFCTLTKRATGTYWLSLRSSVGVMLNVLHAA